MAKPRMRAYASTAAVQAVLVEYDGPQVVLFQSDRGLPAVGVAVGEMESDVYPLFVSETLEATWKRYVAEKVDLRYLFQDGSKRRYFADYSDLKDGRLKLTRADDVNDPDLIPDHGFWARHHTTPTLPGAYASDQLASFAIDGSWDAGDFARFYGRAADLYAYMMIATERAVQSLSANALDAVQAAIASQSFRGGGSYVGFYDRIFNKVDAISPLRVRRISYASPGHIDLLGNEDALGDVARVVESFGADDGKISNLYKEIDGVLKRQQLKRASPSTSFSSVEIESAVLSDAIALNKLLGVDDPLILFDLCEENTLVFSKLTLSFYRRARDLHAFHAEGRVSVAAVDEDTVTLD